LAKYKLYLIRFLLGLPGNLIPRPLHFQLFKILRDFDILVENAVFFMPGDIFDSLRVHAQHNAVCNECFAGGVVGDQFIFRFCMFFCLTPTPVLTNF